MVNHKILFIRFVWVLVLGILFVPFSTEASVIIQAPLYIGLSNGLVGSWTFDGPTVSTNATQMKVNDLSGNNNQGLANTTARPARVAGKIGQALEFDGSDDYVAISDSSVFDLSSSGKYSWSFWLKPDDFEEFNAAWSQFTSSQTAPWFLIYIHTTSDTEVGPVTAGISAWWDESGPTGLVIHTTNNVLEINKWSHITVTYDGSLAQAARMKIYVDAIDRSDTGDVYSSGSIGNISPTETRIGSATFDGEIMDGLIDDVRIYNRALTEKEIKTLYKMVPQ
jgi:hypothetical protein